MIGRSGQVYGPATACLWDSSWDELEEDQKDTRMPWQGEPFLTYSSVSRLNNNTNKKKEESHSSKSSMKFKGKIVFARAASCRGASSDTQYPLVAEKEIVPVIFVNLSSNPW